MDYIRQKYGRSCVRNAACGISIGFVVLNCNVLKANVDRRRKASYGNAQEKGTFPSTTCSSCTSTGMEPNVACAGILWLLWFSLSDSSTSHMRSQALLALLRDAAWVISAWCAVRWMEIKMQRSAKKIQQWLQNQTSRFVVDMRRVKRLKGRWDAQYESTSDVSSNTVADMAVELGREVGTAVTQNVLEK